MSSDWRDLLDKDIDLEFANKKLEIKKNLSCYKSLLLEISKAGKWDIAIWVRGFKVSKFEEYLSEP